MSVCGCTFPLAMQRVHFPICEDVSCVLRFLLAVPPVFVFFDRSEAFFTAENFPTAWRLWGVDGAQAVGVSRSIPSPRCQYGNEADSGWRSGRRLALFLRAIPGLQQRQGWPLLCSSPCSFNVNTINMFVVRPAQLKGENETTEP